MAGRQRSRGTRAAAGFVLSELALVLVVVGVLAAIIVVSVNGIHESNSTGKCQTEVRLLKVATDGYFAENNKYPIHMSELVKADLIELADVPDYTLQSGGPAERPRFRPRGVCD